MYVIYNFGKMLRHWGGKGHTARLTWRPERAQVFTSKAEARQMLERLKRCGQLSTGIVKPLHEALGE